MKVTDPVISIYVQYSLQNILCSQDIVQRNPYTNVLALLVFSEDSL